jgi:hypothetical protein
MNKGITSVWNNKLRPIKELIDQKQLVIIEVQIFYKFRLLYLVEYPCFVYDANTKGNKCVER